MEVNGRHRLLSADAGCGPSPSPGRAIYGFVMCSLAVLSGAIFFIWAFTPPEWLLATGLDYWPQRQWALIVPTLFVLALVVLVVGYPLIGLLLVPGLDDTRVVFDRFSLPEKSKVHPDALPPAYDLHPSLVCRTLYTPNS